DVPGRGHGEAPLRRARHRAGRPPRPEGVVSGRAPERGLPAGDFRWTDREIRAALGLRTDAAREVVVYPRISTDSRAAARGALYVALKGERFDGHAFVADAVASGARGAV